MSKILTLLILILKIIKSPNKLAFGKNNGSKQASSKNNGSKPAFYKNNNNMPALKRNDGNNKVDGLSSNDIEHVKK